MTNIEKSKIQLLQKKGYGYKYAGFMATSSGIASIDGEYQVSLGSNNYSGQEIYIGGHRISFSGGYVRYS